jgi:hypothetical protein
MDGESQHGDRAKFLRQRLKEAEARRARLAALLNNPLVRRLF